MRRKRCRQMMKAVQQHAFGGPEVLSYEDAPMPVLQAGEVLVQVHAVGEPAGQLSARWLSTAAPSGGPRSAFLDLGTDLRWWWRGRMTSGRWRSATKCAAMARFPEGAAGQPRAALACRSATSLANPNPEPSAGCRGADVAPDRPAVLIDPGHEVANPHRPVPLAVNASGQRRGRESVISPCSWRSGRAPR